MPYLLLPFVRTLRLTQDATLGLCEGKSGSSCARQHKCLLFQVRRSNPGLPRTPKDQWNIESGFGALSLATLRPNCNNLAVSGPELRTHLRVSFLTPSSMLTYQKQPFPSG